MYRTHTCGELTIDSIGQTVTLAGWVQKNRDLGQLVFIDLRDRYGLTQLVFEGEAYPELTAGAQSLGREYCIQIEGTVRERERKNLNIPTGEIEVVAAALTILSTSPVPPFTIEDNSDGGEELRMKFRYLDLRRGPLQRAMVVRHRIMQSTRKFLDQQGFLEIETPFLIKSTPEGARDFVVPSRIHQGSVYALPQSPQTFKQLLMMAGYDRYFQIVKCFRDEDFRADRQPEFTQVDCEMAFVEQEDILTLFSQYVQNLFSEVMGYAIGEIPRMTYAEAMAQYGTDKPDLRFGMPIVPLSNLVEGSEFPPFLSALSNENGLVGGLLAQGAGKWTRKQIDAITELAKAKGLSGLVWARHNADGTVKSSADKFFGEEAIRRWLAEAGSVPGDLLLIGAGPRAKTLKALGDLRLELGSQLGLRPKDKFAPLWVVDFPMFAYDENASAWTFEHHPFTSPKREHIHLIDTDPGAVLANAYDFVINGWETCSGSIRIHDAVLQRKIFRAIGLSDAEAEEKFGFLTKALEFGAPPHGGCAFGLDRLAALMVGAESIRDVIAFPKGNSGRDLMLDAPSPIEPDQLKALGMSVA